MNDMMPARDIHAPVPVELRSPWVGGLLAWLWPGAGHLYQRRFAKGGLFMTCILSTYFFGFALGGGRVVYASFKKPDFRYPYLCQVGVGLPALPALAQWQWMKSHDAPLFGIEAMMPPGVVREQQHDTLADWHDELKGFFEIGTVYTMVAGLLNYLAIYDALAGPVFPAPDESRKKKKEEDSPTTTDAGARPVRS
jgi:hypothetical protein